MFSVKWTFSLTILIVIFALCFAASSVLAQFEIKLSVGDEDVSFADGNQVVYGVATTIKIMSTKVVNSVGNVNLAANPAVTSGTGLGKDDFTIVAYNKFGGVVSANAPTLEQVGVDGDADGRHFKANLTLIQASTNITQVLIHLPKNSVELADPRAELNDDGTRKAAGKSKEASIELHYVTGAQGDVDGSAGIPTGQPIVHAIARADGGLRPVTADTFDVLITLSEEAKKDGFKKDHVDVSNATPGDPTLLDEIPEIDSRDAETEAAASGDMPSSGRDGKLYRYIVAITPKYENKNDIVVKIKSFYDQEKLSPQMYRPPVVPSDYKEGVDKLTIKVGKEDPPDKTAGIVVYIPEKTIIPKDGYLVVAKSKGDSAVRDPGGFDKSPKAAERQPFGLTYNLVEGALPNLEMLLINGGTIDIVGPEDLVISEIMWGSDASIDPDSTKSQYIELWNVSGTEIKAPKETYKLVFYTAGTTLPDKSVAANNVQDRVGTVGTGGFWSVVGKGQSGRTGVGEAPGDQVAVMPTQELISMQRVIDATGIAAVGTLGSSWGVSTPPGLNFDPTKEGTRIGSPGRVPIAYPVALIPESEPTPVPIAEADDIMITEIMVDTGNGRLPQWIELTNISGAEVSLAGWSLMISNSDADVDAVGASVNINLSGTLGVGGGADAGDTLGKSLLLVAWGARSSINLSALADRVMNVSSRVGENGRYKLISDMAFRVALIPPQKTSVLTYGDTAGNLDAAEAWDLPMSDGGRSSLIRREALEDGVATMGTAANGWVLASSTALVSGPATWYGSDEDAGTPGYDAGGPLPVELSHFRPMRDKATGAVVITWSTQSELNNAGFFIKRSQRRDGQFKVINATMIAGAGTTREKRFYTYTDTAAQPNVIYYYQIEDISLDGERQTLTRGIRLKGHIGAAGKLMTTWGDLKTQE